MLIIHEFRNNNFENRLIKSYCQKYKINLEGKTPREAYNEFKQREKEENENIENQQI